MREILAIALAIFVSDIFKEYAQSQTEILGKIIGYTGYIGCYILVFLYLLSTLNT